MTFVKEDVIAGAAARKACCFGDLQFAEII